MVSSETTLKEEEGTHVGQGDGVIVPCQAEHWSSPRVDSGREDGEGEDVEDDADDGAGEGNMLCVLGRRRRDEVGVRRACEPARSTTRSTTGTGWGTARAARRGATGRRVHCFFKGGTVGRSFPSWGGKRKDIRSATGEEQGRRSGSLKQTTVSKDFDLDQDPLLWQRQYPRRKSGKGW